MPFLIIGLIILAAALSAYIAIIVSIFKNGICRRAEDNYDRDSLIKRGLGQYADEIVKARNEFLSKSFEDVEITSFDGLKLRGLLRLTPNARGTIILFHGYRGTPDFDFCVSEPFYEKQGMNVLMPYQRSHGKSEGKFITFGVRERKDVHSWINFINKKLGYQNKIILSGLSMGATSVLMSAGEPYSDNVKAIIADCGFTSPYDIFKHVIGHYTKLPFWLLVHPFNLLCKFLAGFKIKEYSTLEALKRCNVPVFLIHGEADDFVPCEMTKSNYEVILSEKKLLTVPGATHALSFMADGVKYREMITETLNCVL